MAAPLGSVTVPLTCATAVTWAFAVECKPARNRIDKDNPANVDRDRCVMTNPLKANFASIRLRRSLGETIALQHSRKSQPLYERLWNFTSVLEICQIDLFHTNH